MSIPTRTITILRMGRSRDQRAAHLAADHGIDVPDDATYRDVVALHGQAHQPWREDPDQDGAHRHTGSCPGCGIHSNYHSCQFGGTGTYEVMEGSRNRTVCRACTDPDRVRNHTCGLRGLQKMLTFGPTGRRGRR